VIPLDHHQWRILDVSEQQLLGQSKMFGGFGGTSGRRGSMGGRICHA